ncbi:MAG: hypothetical protein JWO08_2350 [Verrucomicrobiaceae bacterium]|nr:hypothetical protein [Verrucomicrobiaceae bacterium]
MTGRDGMRRALGCWLGLWSLAGRCVAALAGVVTQRRAANVSTEVAGMGCGGGKMWGMSRGGVALAGTGGALELPWCEGYSIFCFGGYCLGKRGYITLCITQWARGWDRWQGLLGAGGGPTTEGGRGSAARCALILIIHSCPDKISPMTAPLQPLTCLP